MLPLCPPGSHPLSSSAAAQSRPCPTTGPPFIPCISRSICNPPARPRDPSVPPVGVVANSALAGAVHALLGSGLLTRRGASGLAGVHVPRTGGCRMPRGQYDWCDRCAQSGGSDRAGWAGGPSPWGGSPRSPSGRPPLAGHPVENPRQPGASNPPLAAACPTGRVRPAPSRLRGNKRAQLAVTCHTGPFWWPPEFLAVMATTDSRPVRRRRSFPPPGGIYAIHVRQDTECTQPIDSTAWAMPSEGRSPGKHSTFPGYRPTHPRFPSPSACPRGHRAAMAERRPMEGRSPRGHATPPWARDRPPPGTAAAGTPSRGSIVHESGYNSTI